MPRKLPFRVIHASGQDDSYRASELNYHSPLTKGWQASRYKYLILHHMVCYHIDFVAVKRLLCTIKFQMQICSNIKS